MYIYFLVAFLSIQMENVNVCTFNCTGIKSSVEYIAEHLCSDNHIIALQETWLLPHDLTTCDVIHPQFCAFATSSVDVGAGVVRGRPYGGLAFLYRRSIEPHITPITFGEDRVLGLLYKDDHRSILFLNIYLPTQSHENYDRYVATLGRVMAIIHEQEVDAVCVLGDTNAKPRTPFYDELERSCADNDLTVCDVRLLPEDSYTHLNEAHNTTSWLDHVIASDNIADSIHDFRILYGNSTSNHLPVCFKLNIDINYVSYENLAEMNNKVNWAFNNDTLCGRFKDRIDIELSGIMLDFCSSNNCKNEMCQIGLSNFYNTLSKAIIKVGERVFGLKGSARGTPVPGWNELVREHHHLARQAFLAWRTAGSPREGDTAVRMRAYRAQFKLALRECRASEERLRTEAMANELANHNITGYWKSVKRLSPTSNKLSNKLDNATGEQDICKLWREKYVKLFNSVDALNNHEDVLGRNDYCDHITVNQISLLVKNLSVGKAIGVDCIPAEVFIHSSHRLRTLIAIFINACFKHSYIPQVITDTVLVPIVKNKLKPATDSNNYRPIAIATAMSKLIELVILDKCEQYLSTSDNQFGFKKGHSTELCIFSLKEIVNYYNSHGSPVFICFLDIRKAFDRVNYSKLFKKMIARSVPIYLVKLIAFWYVNQRVMVKWGNTLSDPFNVKNGIKQGGLLSPYLFNLYVDKLSVNLNASNVSCTVGNIIVSHLSYADDMVLVAPSKKALQKLLDVCSAYALEFDILYSTDKSYCMICWPRRFLYKFDPHFYLQGDLLEFKNIYKYLGVLITDSMTDDDEIRKRMRNIYATGNMVIRRFANCSVSCKILMFQTFLSQLYGCSLWASYKVASYSKVKVSHNDVFRSLLQVPRYESASTLFVNHAVNNLDAVLRTNYYSLMIRVINSSNYIVSSLRNSQARIHS